MSLFANLLRQFRSDEHGAFAMIFGVTAIVLIALGGAVVDFVSLDQTRNRAQVALDAATLALQKDIFITPVNLEDIRIKALALVNNQIGDTRITATLAMPVIDIPNGSLLLKANVEMPTIFVALVGVQTMRAEIVSEATRKMLDLEVAMVLDNSGSMANSNRMKYLKDAARCATNILFYTDVKANCDAVSTATPAKNVKIGIVPFTIMVNIGTQFQNEPWLDWSGASLLSKLNFDEDDNDATSYGGMVNRRTLFTQTKTNWRGCVEARLAPNDTTDVPPTTTDTKFVPMFSPDTPPGGYNNYVIDNNGGTCVVKTCEQVHVQTNCAKNGGSCTGKTTDTYNKVSGSTKSTSGSSCIPANSVILSGPSVANSGTTRTTTTLYSLLPEASVQARLCKYDNKTKVVDTATKGPNAYCPEVSILPLTSTLSSVLTRITEMRADGGTNIQQGAVWGMHALTANEPMTQALPTEPGTVSKVMILMTDGFNEPDYRAYSDTFNGTAIYGSWGFRKDGRLPDTDGVLNNENEYNAHKSKADMTATMDAKTVATCANAKAPDPGIIIYTIGLSSPSAATTKMLTDCSSGPGYAFFPNNPSELVDVFKTIAGQLAQLRIAQ